MPPLLSIVSVTYKDPEGLARTLASLHRLEGQAFPFEQLVVDSSPEINRSVLEPFRGRWNLRHLEEKPRGVYAAINAGWRAAQGQFVWFLNGGDELDDPATLERACALLAREPSVDMVSGAVRLVRDGRPLYTQPARAGILPLLGVHRVCQQQIIYRRALVERLGGFQEKFRIAADYDFHLRAHGAGIRQEKVEGVLAIFDRSGKSTDTRAAFADFREVHRALAERGELPFSLAHRALLCAAKGRIAIIHALDRIGLGATLRSAWHGLRRSREKSSEDRGKS